MSEYDERNLDDLTEEPTPHRLEELRKKGTVAQSKELSGTISFLAVMITIFLFASVFLTSITEFMKDVFTVEISRKFDLTDWRQLTDVSAKGLKTIVEILAPVAIAGIVFGVVAALGQVGFLLSTESIQPDLKKINPVAGLQRLFSFKSLFEGLKAVLKFIIIGSAVYMAVSPHLKMLPSLVTFNVPQLFDFLGQSSMSAFLVTGVLLLCVAILDYFVQWRRWRKQAMMTKEEAKKEFKEREGDPQIKARIRAIQRDMARKRMLNDVPKADAIITNPTHFAVAIVYSQEENIAPKVVAKGANYLAEKIKKIAKENGIPIVENKPLARSLYKYVKVGQMIPRSLYQATAEVLAYVFKLRGRNLKRSQNNGAQHRL